MGQEVGRIPEAPAAGRAEAAERLDGGGAGALVFGEFRLDGREVPAGGLRGFPDELQPCAMMETTRSMTAGSRSG